MTAGLAASKRVSKGLTFAALVYTERRGDVCSINSFGLCRTLQYITALAQHKFSQKKTMVASKTSTMFICGRYQRGIKLKGSFNSTSQRMKI